MIDNLFVAALLITGLGLFAEPFLRTMIMGPHLKGEADVLEEEGEANAREDQEAHTAS